MTLRALALLSILAAQAGAVEAPKAVSLSMPRAAEAAGMGAAAPAVSEAQLALPLEVPAAPPADAPAPPSAAVQARVALAEGGAAFDHARSDVAEPTEASNARDIAALRGELAAFKAEVRTRNEEKDAHKAWEGSVLRRGAIAGTVGVVNWYAISHGLTQQAWEVAVLSMATFFLTTLSIEPLKPLWSKWRRRRRKQK